VARQCGIAGSAPVTTRAAPAPKSVQQTVFHGFAKPKEPRVTVNVINHGRSCRTRGKFMSSCNRTVPACGVCVLQVHARNRGAQSLICKVACSTARSRFRRVCAALARSTNARANSKRSALTTDCRRTHGGKQHKPRKWRDKTCVVCLTCAAAYAIQSVWYVMRNGGGVMRTDGYAARRQTRCSRSNHPRAKPRNGASHQIHAAFPPPRVRIPADTYSPQTAAGNCIRVLRAQSPIIQCARTKLAQRLRRDA